MLRPDLSSLPDIRTATPGVLAVTIVCSLKEYGVKGGALHSAGIVLLDQSLWSVRISAVIEPRETKRLTKRGATKSRLTSLDGKARYQSAVITERSGTNVWRSRDTSYGDRFCIGEPVCENSPKSVRGTIRAHLPAKRFTGSFM